MPPLWPDMGVENVSRAMHLAANGESDELSVVCAWPLSGQYGTGSRVLYYVLVTACILARKYEWLRDACLAAVLLLPAVAALHGIVLAAVHDNGAVDMDMYGAFQLCAIGILAAPVTVRLSQTYFDRPGRNAIFLWTGIIVAGLMSLSVEFYRANTKPCPGVKTFAYGTERLVCANVTCSAARSPLRTGSLNDIFIIPEPHVLTFGTATLLTAALCVHAILWLLSMLDKILEETSSKYRRGTRSAEDNELIRGTNGATRSSMEKINEVVKRCLSVVVVPVFMAAGLAVLIVGERNFFSKQLSYETEPIQSVGQWAPIAAASLAVIGSLYLLMAKKWERLAGESKDDSRCTCIRCHHHEQVPRLSIMGGLDLAQEYRGSPPGPSLQHSSTSFDQRRFSDELSRRTSEAVTVDAGKRRTVAQAFLKASKIMGMAAREWTDDSEFQRGRAQDFPEIPGEASRNRQLSQIRTQYNRPRGDDGLITPRPARSRASSFVGSLRARRDDESSWSGGRPELSLVTPTTRDTTSPPRASLSVTSTGDEGSVELREFSRSTDSHGEHLESPNLLEVPRPAFMTTRSAFGDHVPD